MTKFLPSLIKEAFVIEFLQEENEDANEKIICQYHDKHWQKRHDEVMYLIPGMNLIND